MRRGYAIVWILVVIAILTTVAALAASSLAVDTRYAAMEQTAQLLDDLSVAINTFETNVNQANGAKNNFPGRLSELTNQVRSGQLTTCSGAGAQVMTAHDSSDWAGSGPFFTKFEIDSNGAITPLGRIKDTLQRAGGTNPGTNPIFLVIPYVSASDARILNQIVDAGVNDGGTGDTVQFDSTQADTVTVFYRVTPRQNNKC
jgi:type II secretory pathway pseudopilin PulG